MHGDVKIPIPYGSIKTLFLDVGNTLVSMDFEWIQYKLQQHGMVFSVEKFQRAEAVARTIVSDELNRLKSTETEDTFRFYFITTLRNLLPSSNTEETVLESLWSELLPVFKKRNQTQRLWSRLLPGIPEALDRLQTAGLQLVAVSNADGTVEKSLTILGLRRFFDAVIDSHVVGFEKPDPRVFYHAISVSGADPKSTLHVGDMYAVDIVGANAAGIYAVLLDPYKVWHRVDCHKISDLPCLVDRILS